MGIRGENIAPSRDGLYHVPTIAQCLPQKCHLLSKIAVLDYCGWPKAVHDLLFGHDEAAGIEKHDQKIERTASNLHWLTVLKHLTRVRTHTESAEMNRGVNCFPGDTEAAPHGRIQVITMAARDLTFCHLLIHDDTSIRIFWTLASVTEIQCQLEPGEQLLLGYRL